MLKLAKAFWDIALWRRTPAQLPASILLLTLVSAVTALLEVLSAFLPPVSSDQILARIVLSLGLPLAFCLAVLYVARRRQRFLQTGIALLGVGVLAELVLNPIQSLIHVVGSDSLASAPLGFLWLTGLIWYLLACANIWRVALDSGIALGIAVSAANFVLSILLELQTLSKT
jgi:hypothetical protein